ncbi:hypothetical protein GCM10007063_01320 [Lentibacillus kapialis]|uniref:Transcriptional regulator n=1 Tax=Lentibacillus kapialis TaxID=340214 RepID=A0A917PK74_9BACI|nr:hypothetical protein GCM10007063_01320 [Lentibacillus kapialis]
MKIKIAVFGHKDISHKLYSYATTQEDIEIFLFEYSNPDETVALVEKAIMCDIYLFTDALAYLYAKELIDKKRLPAVQVDFNAYMILSSFYRLTNDYKREVKRLSIDIPENKHVDEVLHDLNINDQDIYTYSYGNDPYVDTGRIASYHEKLWQEGKIDFVLTSIREVDQIIRKKGIPGNCMIIPELNLVRAMEKAKSIATINNSQGSQIVTSYVRIKSIKTNRSEKNDLYMRELHSKLQRILMNYSSKVSASVISLSNGQFVLFGTHRMLDHITSSYRDFALLNEIENALNTPVDIGFGLGLSPKQADDNAKLALKTCEEKEDGTCYIINERRDMIGPLGVKKEFNPSALYRSLIHKAKLNNELSYNFIDFIEVRNNEPFSSNDIATYYGVTKRSAERTIKKLVAGNVIKVIGEEKPYIKGRPRKLFKLNQ